MSPLSCAVNNTPGTSRRGPREEIMARQGTEEVPRPDDIASTTRAERMENVINSSTERFSGDRAETDAWVWRIDLDGTYTYSSDGVERILGYTSEEIIGRKFYSFFHPDDRARLTKEAMAAIAAGRPFSGLRNRNTRKDGTTVVLET
ncbi:MAG TPA: PAS domain S-box protein, partial [Candidatus Acetothermia bacterium]|nr:PAS domain S-box protein [Candidatus Acetothermia bacterium]HEX32604.1 PAS domain S-box protein [Candidatus Acetothermia bacterium]